MTDQHEDEGLAVVAVATAVAGGCGESGLLVALSVSPRQAPAPPRSHDVFKLALEAQKRWDRLQGYNLPPLVAQGVRFVDGEIDQAA